MAVKIIITRTIHEGQIEDLTPLIRKLRTLAAQRPGYISGETLRSVDNPGEYLVISAWNSVEDWKEWEVCKERNSIQSQIDALLGESTEYKIYAYRN